MQRNCPDLFYFGFFFICTALVVACTSKKATTEQDTQTLMHIFNNFDGSSLVLAVSHNGALIHYEQAGFSDVRTGKLLSRNTKFRVASLSKTITAMAAMQLVEQGKLKLDADVSAVLGFSLRNPAFPQAPVTLRQLLSHTSTVRDGPAYDRFLQKTIASNGGFAMKTLFETAGDSVWSAHTPGSWFAYCNLGYGLIGTLIEKASGKRFDQYCRENLFLPAGINASFNVSDFAETDTLAVLFRKRDGQWMAQVDDFTTGRPDPERYDAYIPGTNASVFGPQGGLRISALDMLALIEGLRTDGRVNGVHLLSAETVKQMKTEHWRYDGANGEPYGGLFNAWGLGLHIAGGNGKDDIIKGQLFTGHPGDAYGLLADAYFNETFSFVFISGGIGIPNKEADGSAFYEVEAAAFRLVEQAMNR
jgi:CubicO group peptidase (beta-lactamase class C family)